MHCKLQFPVIRNKEHYAKGQSILNTTHKERGTIELLDPCCSTRCQSRMKTHLHDCCAEKEREKGKVARGSMTAKMEQKRR